MKEILRVQNLPATSRQVSPPSLLDVSAYNFLRTLVDEAGMIRAQIGTHNRSEMIAVHGTMCVRLVISLAHKSIEETNENNK
jgi:hypothetical protein